MSVSLYMDHHVKAAITDGLRRRGVDVLTCLEDGTDRAEDELVLKRATELGRIIFTQDDDFLALADEWLESDRDFAGVIYAHQLGITIGQAIRDIEKQHTCCEPHENDRLPNQMLRCFSKYLHFMDSILASYSGLLQSPQIEETFPGTKK